MIAGPEATSLQLQSFVAPLAARLELAGADLGVERLDDAELNGRPHFVLAASRGSTPLSTLYVDRETGLVSQSAGVANIPGLGDVKSVTDFGGYEAVGGVMLPTTITVAMEGISTTRITWTNTVVNTDVDESIFSLPEAAAGNAAAAAAPADPYGGPYQEHCSVCHGAALEGAAQGTPLVRAELRHGDTVDALSRSIATGFAATGMPAWSETLDGATIRRMAIFVK